MVDCPAAGVGDDAAAVKFARQPIAQFDAAIAPVNAVGADDSGHSLAMPDAGGKAVMCGEHFKSGTNESDSIVFGPGRIYPWQPLPQVFAVALHCREHFGSVMFLQQAEFK